MKNSKLFYCFFIFLLLCLISGCGLNQLSKNEKIISTIHKNVQSAEDEDLVAYLSTLSEESRGYQDAQRGLPTIFDLYDLSYTTKDVEVIESDFAQAKVRYIQITKRINGPDFRDNKTTIVATLLKVGDEWKIYKSEIKNIQYLD